MHIIEALVIYQPVAMILASKPFDLAPLMFQSSPIDAVRHADVKRSRAAAHDIDEILVILHANPTDLSS
jgi:hypothetical protein